MKVRPVGFDAWLDPAAEALQLLDRNLGSELRMERVSRKVRSSRYLGEDASEPLDVNIPDSPDE